MSTRRPRLSEYSDRSVFWLAVLSVVSLLIGLQLFGAFSNADSEVGSLLYSAVLSLLLLVKVAAYLIALRPATTRISWHVGWLYVGGILPALYFGVALANVVLHQVRFGGQTPPFPYWFMVYGQIFGPDWYVFGWPDMLAAVALAVILDVIVLRFFPLPSRQLPRLVFASALANLLVYGLTTIIFLHWLRTPFFS